MSINSFSADHLNQKLDGLNLTDKSTRIMTSKPSLLSSSLANERLNSRINKEKHQVNNTIDNNLDDPHYEMLSDHPEPELLATSVGKDSEGRLIPSSSTISLLSLSNHQGHLHHVQGQQVSSGGVSSNTSPQLNQYSQFEDNQTFTPGQNINRMSGIRSRNSITHLNQKRFETYTKLTSPPPGSTPGTTPGPVDMIDHSTSQSIPINGKLIPDSPSLDPTSLNGSPSRFWLSSQTPPRSLTNSYKKVSVLSHLQSPQQQLQQQQAHQVQVQQLHSQLYQLSSPDQQQQQSQQSQEQSQQHQPIDSSDRSGSRPMTIPMNRKGSDSPILNPVQTPQEEMPMTPLYLNNGFQGNNYFNLEEHINEVDEPAESSDEEMET